LRFLQALEYLGYRRIILILRQDLAAHSQSVFRQVLFQVIVVPILSLLRINCEVLPLEKCGQPPLGHIIFYLKFHPASLLLAFPPFAKTARVPAVSAVMIITYPPVAVKTSQPPRQRRGGAGPPAPPPF